MLNPVSDTQHLPWADLEEELLQESPQQWYERIRAVDSNNLVNLHRMVINRFATPAELQACLEAHRRDGSPWPSMRNWEFQASTFVPGLIDEPQPIRRHRWEAAGFHFYAYGHETAGTERPCLIGLPGDYGLLMAPGPFVIEALARLGWDLILVRRQRRESFLAGDGARLLELSDALQATLPGISGSLGAGDGRRCAVLGSSTGALAALVLAEQLGARRGIALCALASEAMLRPGDGVLDRCRHPEAEASAGPSNLLLVYPAEHDQDRDHALRIASYYRTRSPRPGSLTLRGYEGCHGHTLHRDLVEQGWTLTEIHRHLLEQAPLPPIRCREERLIPPA
ncbi:hypothetical protein [Cyanobium sp. CH-040]|uniref:hypothetical protein n=1 Tax=Cyanobium sp. CH-040 TaxID=2823708 RepID=UPI0020CF6F48|nr:hypothetical protein [Cyanobium sp. CH-040]MCP9928331.1 hypothetical protein [Cyanobium sp. CH-040]